MDSKTKWDYRDDADSLFNSTYMRWWHLQGADLLVRITKVERNVELVLPGGARAKRPVVHWSKLKGRASECKPLVLNVTNKNSLVEILGRSVSKWAGKEVVFFESTALLRGREVPALRIRAKKETK